MKLCIEHQIDYQACIEHQKTISNSPTGLAIKLCVEHQRTISNYTKVWLWNYALNIKLTVKHVLNIKGQCQILPRFDYQALHWTSKDNIEYSQGLAVKLYIEHQRTISNSPKWLSSFVLNIKGQYQILPRFDYKALHWTSKDNIKFPKVWLSSFALNIKGQYQIFPRFGCPKVWLSSFTLNIKGQYQIFPRFDYQALHWTSKDNIKFPKVWLSNFTLNIKGQYQILPRFGCQTLHWTSKDNIKFFQGLAVKHYIEHQRTISNSPKWLSNFVLNFKGQYQILPSFDYQALHWTSKDNIKFTKVWLSSFALNIKGQYQIIPRFGFQTLHWTSKDNIKFFPRFDYQALHWTSKDNIKLSQGLAFKLYIEHQRTISNSSQGLTIKLCIEHQRTISNYPKVWLSS